MNLGKHHFLQDLLTDIKLMFHFILILPVAGNKNKSKYSLIHFLKFWILQNLKENTRSLSQSLLFEEVGGRRLIKRH